MTVPAIWNLRNDGETQPIKLYLLVGPDHFHHSRLSVPDIGAAFRLIAKPFDEWWRYGKRDDVCPLSEDAFTEAIHEWNSVHAESAEEEEHGHNWKWLGLLVDMNDGALRGSLTMELNHTVGQVSVARDAIDGDATKLLGEFVTRAKAVLK